MRRVGMARGRGGDDMTRLLVVAAGALVAVLAAAGVGAVLSGMCIQAMACRFRIR